MKKCPYCAEEVQEEAVVCRHCNRDLSQKKSFQLSSGGKGKKASPAAWGCLTILIVGVAIVVATSFGGDSDNNTNTSTEPEQPKAAILSVGEEGIINNNDDPSDCSGGALVASSKEAFDKLTEASVANDKTGLNELMLAGQVFLADNCSKVLMLDFEGFAVSKIRFINPDASNYNQVGFIASEFAVK